ncbi:hypothetical protein [Parvularcula maris]|uniref:Uncharacterized protein n=1 Tax=Parvularcula maris TaxID=2965077 RepID=A0A9X2RJT5_9PROT|nr:hypothetical protein [Parvularcula maris]MCQ8186241.1 hypothetical protein [Parvularcula maris]
MDHGFFEFGQIGVFTFVILIVFIGGLFQYLRVRSTNETLRKLAESGQPIDRELLGSVRSTESDGGPSSYFVGGIVTIAAAAALYVFGQQLGDITGDPQLGPVMRAVAVFPAFIGGALLVAGLVVGLTRKGRTE